MRDVTCRYHPHAPASYECAGCHKRFCSECVKEISGKTYCKVCESRLEGHKGRRVKRVIGRVTGLGEDWDKDPLLKRLQEMGVEGHLMKWDGEVVRLHEQEIDAIGVYDAGGGPPGGGSDGLRCLLFSGMGFELMESAPDIEARTKQTKEHKFWGKVRNLKWVGGPIIQLLNDDIELSRLLIEGGQTKIRIMPDPQKQQVAILVDPGLFGGGWELSKASFTAYKRIAKHIRNYLTSHAGKAKTDARDVYRRPW